MNKVKLILGLLFFSALISCSNNKEKKDNDSDENSTAEKSVIAPENMASADLNIEGMVCEGCQHTIQDEISKITGVGSCEVSLKEKVAHINYDKTKLSDDDLIKAIGSIEDGTYKASKEKVNENTNENSTNSSEQTSAQVSLKSFEIPNLFTLIMNQF